MLLVHLLQLAVDDAHDVGHLREEENGGMDPAAGQDTPSTRRHRQMLRAARARVSLPLDRSPGRERDFGRQHGWADRQAGRFIFPTEPQAEPQTSVEVTDPSPPGHPGAGGGCREYSQGKREPARTPSTPAARPPGKALALSPSLDTGAARGAQQASS